MWILSVLSSICSLRGIRAAISGDILSAHRESGSMMCPSPEFAQIIVHAPQNGRYIVCPLTIEPPTLTPSRLFRQGRGLAV